MRVGRYSKSISKYKHTAFFIIRFLQFLEVVRVRFYFFNETSPGVV